MQINEEYEKNKTEAAPMVDRGAVWRQRVAQKAHSQAVMIS